MNGYEYKRCSFLVEWDDEDASLVRKFQMLYYLEDDTIELYELRKNKGARPRLFLKRTRVAAVNLGSMHVGSTFNVMGRNMRISDFADEFTRNKLGKLLQVVDRCVDRFVELLFIIEVLNQDDFLPLYLKRTFAMLKPDAMDRSDEILNLIKDRGFKIVNMKTVSLDRNDILRLYKEHEGKPFLGFLVNYLTTSPCLAMELVAENAVSHWMEFVGPTDSERARVEAPGSLRALYGRDKGYNAVHGSKNEEDSKRELDIFFPSTQVGNLSPPRTSATLEGTLCIVKPHALKEGHLGSILQEIRKGGFRVIAMQMFYVERVNAEELYEVYKGVVPEYADMVDELTQGACVALEVRYDANVGDSHSRFRELAGPRDPDIARHIEPSTLRAKFGKTRVENAVHCTDIPEDVVSEVEYFFLMLQ
uniref:DM10 domain-containing protein n=1 Tax=Timema shepardi TaxID=629360 RepID=A0A7R9FV66_TIMSH|nr:unnamed protein product [Timema shepardi]